MKNIVWQNENFYILKHESPLPWLKLFTKEPYKELTEIPKEQRDKLYTLIENIELAIIEFYNPDKVNIASFGNMLPHMHWHIIARFKNDPYFPKTTWEEPVREFNLKLAQFKDFKKILNQKLDNL
jgi:diadenosine tetraphosphate (Ap4A) HIT family hydrolase